MTSIGLLTKRALRDERLRREPKAAHPTTPIEAC